MIESIDLFESAGALYCVSRDDDGASFGCQAVDAGCPHEECDHAIIDGEYRYWCVACGRDDRTLACEHDWDRAECEGYAARGCTICGLIEPLETED